MGRGDLTVPVVEGWTALAMAAGATSRISVGSFVLNVVNRHPAVVARMASTLQIASGGRLVLGIGIGGHPKEHAAYGIEFPPPPERVARLEEAVAVIRALWTGGPVTRESPFYPLVEAYARPVPDPAPPIIIGGETPAGARLAARIGDGWTHVRGAVRGRPAASTSRRSRRPASGARTRRVYVGFQGEWLSDETLDDSPWVLEPRETWERWRAAGADGAIVLARTTADVDAAGGRGRALVEGSWLAAARRGGAEPEPRGPARYPPDGLLGAKIGRSGPSTRAPVAHPDAISCTTVVGVAAVRTSCGPGPCRAVLLVDI